MVATYEENMIAEIEADGQMLIQIIQKPSCGVCNNKFRNVHAASCGDPAPISPSHHRVYMYRARNAPSATVWIVATAMSCFLSLVYKFTTWRFTFLPTPICPFLIPLTCLQPFCELSVSPHNTSYSDRSKLIVSVLFAACAISTLTLPTSRVFANTRHLVRLLTLMADN